MLRLISTLSAVLIIFTMTANAQIMQHQKHRNFDIGLSGGAFSINPVENEGDLLDMRLRLMARYDIIGALRGEISGAYGELRHSEAIESRIIPLEARIMYAPLAQYRLSPYMFGGFGAAYFDTRQSDNSIDNGWSSYAPVGGGLEIGLNDYLAIDLSGGYHYLLSSNFTAVENANENGFWGMAAGLTIRSNPKPGDSDMDGLNSEVEKRLGTSDELADSDHDGITDDVEYTQTATNPLKADTDEDNLSDRAEVRDFSTDPNNKDTDGDQLHDGNELALYGTDPNKHDTDEDGLSDGSEILVHATDPLRKDSDNDKLSDAVEVDAGSDPNMQDSDEDGLSDGQETQVHHTRPDKADTDGGTVSDGVEVARGSDPMNASDDIEKKQPASTSLLGAGIGMPVVLTGVYFETNSANLDVQSEEYLNQVAETMRQFPNTRIEIHGHTDSRGAPAYNMDLSDRRASAVMAYLQEQGISHTRIKAVGFGEEMPIASNDTRKGREKNRRIELVRMQ